MSINLRKKREREQRIELFLDSAETLFFKQGYESTTIAAIAEAASFSKRTIYLYFQDKWDLFLGIVLRGQKELIRRIKRVDRQEESGLDRIQAISRAFFEFGMENPDYFDALFTYELREYHHGRENTNLPYFAAACLEANHLLTQLAQNAIQSGLEDGSISSHLDTVQLTLILWAEMVGLVQVLVRRKDILLQHYRMDATAFFDHFLKANRQSLGTKGVAQ